MKRLLLAAMALLMVVAMMAAVRGKRTRRNG